MLPRSSRPPARKRCSTRGLRATVRKSRSGGAPRMILSNSAWMSAGYGGSMGGIRTFGISAPCHRRVLARAAVGGPERCLSPGFQLALAGHESLAAGHFDLVLEDLPRSVTLGDGPAATL